MRNWGNMQGVTLISTALAIALIVWLARFVTRHERAALPADAYRHVFRRSLFRLSAWALAGYMAYMVVVSMVLNLIGFQYPESS
jgi:Ca2+/Na+ antiporter